MPSVNKKIGIVSENFGASQQAFTIINSANEFAKNNTNCCILFNLEYVPHCIKSDVCVMNVSELFGYSACIISCCLESTKFSLKASGNGPRIFYIWDIFFLRKGSEIYDENIKVLTNSELLLVCRSNDHADMVENYCNRRPAVIPFDIKTLMDLGYRLGSYNRTIPEWISKIPEI